MNKSTEFLSELIRYMKYSRYLPELKRRETWAETILRNKQMHLNKYADKMTPDLRAKIDRAYELAMDKRILPSGRSLQFGGDSTLIKENRIYNCAAIGLETIDSFSDLMYSLLCGNGVGISVRKYFVERLPSFPSKFDTIETFVIPDSIEGWSDAIKFIFTSLQNGIMPEFDYSLIRPAGALIRSSMACAPGPEPLKRSLDKIIDIMTGRFSAGYSKLSPLNCCDICCWIGDCVMAGGVRRSAIITLFDIDDEEMLHCKDGNYWEDNPQRSVSNNSIQFDRSTIRKEDFEKVFDICRNSGTGEPGFFIMNREPDGTPWVVNPCGEIAMRSKGYCNLTTMNVSTVKDQKDFNTLCYYTSVLGTLQAGYTNLKYITPEWTDRVVEDALIGVAMTGTAGIDINSLDLAQGVAEVMRANDEISSMIDINPAARCTTIKPDGTCAPLMQASSGVHCWHSPFFIRRIRVAKTEPLYKYLMEKNPEIIEDDINRPTTTAVMSFYIKAPESAICRKDETAVEFLERVKHLNLEWVQAGHRKGANHNNVSCTVNVKDNEWDEVCKWMWDNRDSYNGISLMPYSDANYKQAPFEEITEEEYIKGNELQKNLDLSKVTEEKNFVDFSADAVCAAGACEIV